MSKLKPKIVLGLPKHAGYYPSIGKKNMIRKNILWKKEEPGFSIFLAVVGKGFNVWYEIAGEFYLVPWVRLEPLQEMKEMTLIEHAFLENLEEINDIKTVYEIMNQ